MVEAQRYLTDGWVEQRKLVNTTRIEAGTRWQDEGFDSNRFSGKLGLRRVSWANMRLVKETDCRQNMGKACVGWQDGVSEQEIAE